ncbi:MAG TPA: serine hydrolase [Steroidobacteraceae bacterium]|nr:serine hydrolase [Steroidobacteraceae bacterium]
MNATPATAKTLGLALVLLLAGGAARLATAAGRPATPAAHRTLLTFRTLMSGEYPATVPLSAYTPTRDASPPTNRFEGTLSLRYSGTLPSTVVFTNPAFVSDANVASARTWPADFSYQFVQQGGDLIPVRRGVLRSSHAWWETILEPGRVWNEPGDHGYSRAAIPFSFQERNANCTHNGVLMFLFRSDGRISRTALQITGETCEYLRLDLWGLLDSNYAPSAVADKDRLVAGFRDEVAARLPTGTLAQLHARYPRIDLGQLAIGAGAGRTLYGVVIDGVNYVSGCATRNGDYPYCDVLDLPSFSTAKSAFAALALMHLERQHPGVKDRLIASLVPECQQPAWRGVTLLNALDMATGNYDLNGYEEDEAAPKTNGLFLPDDHQAKITYSCGAYARRAPPGTRWVYHTSDTYILGTALNHYFQSLPGHAHEDVFDDLVVRDLFAPLQLSPSSRVTKRTYDSVAQPFTGWGLTWHRDDVARLGKFLAADHGTLRGAVVLDPALFEAAMQRTPTARGLQTVQLRKFRYQHGFWARNLQEELGCAHQTWVPFMSGFGGISVVLFPNGIVYYNFADDGRLESFDFLAPALAMRRVADYCS